ncbi:MAG: NAD(P)-dependent oxidoreductase [Candidatus Moranbacteria bacterium]|nr:NAD(P)-dependent oxidoreductase [Candidatus Moranbacteria bacterium]
MDKRKILVLGGEGFIGRNINQTLAGQYECFSMGIKRSIFPERKDIFLEANPYQKKIRGSYEVFIHLIDNQVNVADFATGEMKLVENVGIKRGAHLIIFSSAAIYANPDSDYAKRKISFEEFYLDHCRSNGINLTIFRLFNVYGLYQLPYRQGGLVANIFINHLNGKATEINDPKVCRDFLYASDAGKFVKYAIENNSYLATDIGSGGLTTIKDLIDIIENKIIKEKLKISSENRKEYLNISAANNKLLKNVPLTSLEVGLAETYQFYKNNLSLINKYLSL